MTSEYEHPQYPILAQSAERYRLAGRHIVGMIANRIGQPVPETASSAIENMMVVACYTDNAFDNAAEQSHDAYRRLYDDSAGFLLSSKVSEDMPQMYIPCSREASTVRLYLANHDADGRNALGKDFALYHRLGGELREARSAKLYAAITRIEGRVAMRCLLDLLPQRLRTDPSYQPTFSWLIRLGQLANTYDSMADSASDVRSGRVRAGSPLRLRFALARAALQDIGPVARELSLREWLGEVKDFTGVLRGTSK